MQLKFKGVEKSIALTSFLHNITNTYTALVNCDDALTLFHEALRSVDNHNIFGLDKELFMTIEQFCVGKCLTGLQHSNVFGNCSEKSFMLIEKNLLGKTFDLSKYFTFESFTSLQKASDVSQPLPCKDDRNTTFMNLHHVIGHSLVEMHENTNAMNYF